MNEQEFKNYCKAGQVANKIRKHLKKFVKIGMPLIEIAEQADKMIEQVGTKPAFPINLSLNEVAAHYTPLFR